MTTKKQWEIWLAQVKFESDPNQVKLRPVLIVEPTREIYFSLKITSHPPRGNFRGEYEIIKWEAAGLEKPSTIRTSKRLPLKDDDFQRKIGSLHPIDIRNVQTHLSVLY